MKYTLELTKDSLCCRLKVKNQSDTEPLEFAALFHNYFAVDDIQCVGVEGLQGLEYKYEGDCKDVEKDTVVRIGKEVDRVYCGWNGRTLTLRDGSSVIKVSGEGMEDVVVWNPWAEKAKALSDFGDEEYRQMLCIEPGTVHRKQILAPGKSWQGSQFLQVIRQ